MKRCEKPLTAVEYSKDFHSRFLAEFNKKLNEQKGYYKKNYVKIKGLFAV